MDNKSLNNHSIINLYNNYKDFLITILKYKEEKYYKNKIKNNNINLNIYGTLNKL